MTNNHALHKSKSPALTISTAGGLGASFRPEIQGLRAIAVLAVVLYHLWPNRLSGGFVGVDVFFVISGYLITEHMYRDIQSGSGLSLRKFWERRVRRLLPAAFVVLIASIVGVYLFMPETLWQSNGRQIGASAVYLQNWILAADAVDYSALNAAATVAQHFWSLSIEEQFYFFWPLIIISLLWLQNKIAKHRSALTLSPRTTLITGLFLIGGTSLFYSIFKTNTDPDAAYFVTYTRVWEFIAGALVALIFLGRQRSGLFANILAWAGLGSILLSGVLYNGTTPFPGYTALLPVIGTALLLFCSANLTMAGPTWLLSRRPVTFIGDISYAIYLWHWPLIVIVPYALDIELSDVAKIGILVTAILLAWVTKIMLEDPLRRGTLLRGSARTFSFAAVGMTVISALSFGLTSLVDISEPYTAQVQSSSCYGPAALDPVNNCPSILGHEEPIPSAVAVSQENNSPLYPGCQASFAGSELVSCTLGVPTELALATVAIVGDSHATAWYPAIDALATEHKWSVVTYAKASCPVSNALRILTNEKTSQNQSDCHDWVQKVNDSLTMDSSISVIFTAAYSSAYEYASASDEALENPAIDGFTQMWARWQSSGKTVIVFDDVPRTNGQYIPSCLAENPQDPMNCAYPTSDAIPVNMNITEAAAAAVKQGVIRIKLREQFCDSNWCYPIIGSVIAYRDYSHLSATYSLALAPFIDTQIQDLTNGQK